MLSTSKSLSILISMLALSLLAWFGWKHYQSERDQWPQDTPRTVLEEPQREAGTAPPRELSVASPPGQDPAQTDPAAK